MRKIALGAVIGAMFLAPSAQAAAPVQTITLVNQLGNRAPYGVPLKAFRAAMVTQSRELRRYWGTPLVRFGAGGWPLYLRHTSLLSLQDCTSCDGEHGVVNGEPSAWEALSNRNWTIMASHELMEMLVNPYRSRLRSDGSQEEVCDPVANNNDYVIATSRLRLIWVADFVTPAWSSGGPDPWDFAGVLRAPRS